MDPPIKLFGQTIAASSAFTASSGDGDDGEPAATTSSGRWNDVPFSSQEVKKNRMETSGVGEVDGDGATCMKQNSKSGSLPDLTSSASNSAEEEKLCVSPRGGGCGGVDENRTPLTSQGDGRVDDENSEDEDGSQANGRGRKEGLGGGESEMGKGGEKMPRRPENAVACPRCQSLETKFCYYNNYNVNQPRHFCKHCQRYWTAGGTLRNVPVGAGRRKNKHTNGSTIVPRGQTPEGVTVRSDSPDIASPLIATKGIVPVPIQVSLVQGAGGKGGVMRMSVPATGDPSVLPLLRMQPQPVDPASIFISSSETGTSSDTGTVVCKRSRLATPVYSDASTCANDMDHQQGGWVQKSLTNKEESACSSVTPTSSNIVVHEIKGEPGAACPMMGVAPSPALTVPVVGIPDQQHPVTNNTTMAGPGAWSGSNSQAPGSTGAPFGFYNGGWPYGYNVGVGWSGPPAFCAGGVSPAGTPGGGVTGPPPLGNIGAAWNGTTGSVWTGVPWPMPGLAWGPPWAMAPWAMATVGPGGVSMGPMTQTVPMSSGPAAGIHTTSMPCGTSAAAAGGSGSPSSSLGKHSRGGPQLRAAATCDGAGGRGRMDGNGGLWAPKSLRMADPEEAVRSSVWRILGVRSKPNMTTGGTFNAFQTRNESKKIADDDQQVTQASLHANPAAMSRSMNFQESN
ncbi:hypothetical protein R1flu_019866 [Riccia fluitans]|uniref:Dof-type domain-containing protein n=1 Tax=Riccia fluitans TaxID=41844 RepID=A0ABD1ZK39_9MARC